MIRGMRTFVRRGLNSVRYEYLAAKVERSKFVLEDLKAEGYCSQCGQDKWIVERLFPGETKGTFVDIGANDGIAYSNTYVLEKLGWDGLAVEPIPSVYERLVRNRRCTTVHGCVAPRSGRERFRVVTGYPEMLSGLVGEYDPRHLERIDRELRSHGGEYTDIDVSCYNFNELMDGNGIVHVDYLSIDVEGAEYEILDSIDFDRTHVSVIGVENAYSDYRIPRLLAGRGFEFRSVVGDEFYVNRRRTERGVAG